MCSEFLACPLLHMRSAAATAAAMIVFNKRYIHTRGLYNRQGANMNVHAL